MTKALRLQFLSFALLFALALPVSLHSQELTFEAFPETRAFPVFLADGMAHQLSLTRVTDNREWIGAIGASVPLAEVRTGEWTVQGGAAATTFNRIIKTPGHITVYTIDYKVDFPLDVRRGNLAGRIALGHVSSHYADDGIEILKKNSISYVRDYMTFAAAYDLESIRATAYASCDWNFHYEPVSDHWIVQLGMQGGFLPLSSFARLYGAVDIKLRQNLNWGTTQSYQIGVQLFPRGRYALRVAYTLRTGLEERGQLYDARAVMHLLGATIDI